MQGVVCAQEGAETAAGFVGLYPAVGGEFYTMVGDSLVDLSVF